MGRGETKGPASKLAWNLKPFGIAPQKMRLDENRTARGNLRADLEPVWERYLPPSPEKTDTAILGLKTGPLTRDVPTFRQFRLLQGTRERNKSSVSPLPGRVLTTEFDADYLVQPLLAEDSDQRSVRALLHCLTDAP